MKRLSIKLLLPALGFFLICSQVSAQEAEKKGYQFTLVKELPSTPVKNQYKSSTCWSFSTISFLESELLRLGKGERDLSEMFIVYNTYYNKAIQYARWQGNVNFAAGGAFHDVLSVIENVGIVPEEVYSGKVIGEKDHIHNEMDAVLTGFMEALIKNQNGKLSPVWPFAIKGILDAYLGVYPDSFTLSPKGIQYTPKQYAGDLGLDLGNYIEIGSYTHHPFYGKFIIELPDNWMMDEIYNVPLDEMMAIIDFSLEQGYTVGWGADISEKGFSWTNGVAVVPAVDIEDIGGTEREKWEKLTQKEREKMMYGFSEPVPERVITQEIRQTAFDNYQTTDDHGMHITGTGKDQNGTIYYYVKNSWGITGNDYKGFFYASGPYVEYKTISILVHKDGVPKEIRKKLGL
ncbi:MAG: aminopeptidase [Bacteroidales bacterium]|nr:aminopeptidase [Bacteroidales bacterium]